MGGGRLARGSTGSFLSRHVGKSVEDESLEDEEEDEGEDEVEVKFYLLVESRLLLLLRSREKKRKREREEKGWRLAGHGRPSYKGAPGRAS